MHRSLILMAAAALCATQTLAGTRPIPQPLTRPPERLYRCSSVYPDSPLASEARRVTDLAIHISVEGLVSAARVTGSSGDERYDAAAVQCADGFFTQPGYVDGKPIEFDWVARVDWRRPREMTFMSIPLADESRRFCVNYPELAQRLGEQGQVIVTYMVAADGTTHDLQVGRSSGYDDLDSAAMSCIAAYRFFPATRAGEPVEFEWRSAYVFTLH